MKQNLLSFLWLFSLSFSLMGNSLLYGDEGVATVLLMKGTVNEINPNGESKVLTQGSWVKEKSKVTTGPGSFAKLLFMDKSSINVGPNSAMEVTHFQKKEPGVISLIKGQIRSKVEKNLLSESKTKKESTFFVKTKGAAMGVRGTDFVATHEPDTNATGLDVISGTVAMVNTAGFESGQLDIKTMDQMLNSPTAVKVGQGMRTNVASPANPPKKPQEIPKKELDNMKKNENALPKTSAITEVKKEEKKEEKKEDKKKEEPKKEEKKKEEVKKEEAKKEGPKKEVVAAPAKKEVAPITAPKTTEAPKLNSILPPGAPKDLFVSSPPTLETALATIVTPERAPTSEPSTSQVSSGSTSTENTPPPTETTSSTPETTNEVVDVTVPTIDQSEINDIIEQTTTDIENTIEETQDTIEQQNTNNFTKVRFIFDTQ